MLGAGEWSVAITLEISVAGSRGRPKLVPGGPGAPATDIPAHAFLVDLDLSGDWRFRPPYSPYWRYLAPASSGRWDSDRQGQIRLRDGDGHTAFTLAGFDRLSGKAGLWPGRDGTLSGQGTWKPAGVPLSRVWMGFMASPGAAGAGGGVSASVAQMWGGRNSGCSFSAKPSRLGAGSGFSGGAGLVLAVGFASANDFHGFSGDGGWDFAPAVGRKLAALAKPRWSRIAAALGRLESGSEIVFTGTDPKYRSVRDELGSLAKTIAAAVPLDPDTRSLVVVDVPAANADARLGVHCNWTGTTLARRW